jgi:hypothetical protein
LWLGVFLFSLSAGLAAQSKPVGAPASTAKAAAQEPFDLMEVEGMLRGGLTPKRIISLIEQNGVSFGLTANVEKELGKLGADDRLLLAIARNRVQPAPNVAAPLQSLPLAPSGAQSALTWTDPATGLMWAKESNGSNVTWNQAKRYCADLNLGGYSNWRLATIAELEEIYDPAKNVGPCHVKGEIRFHDLCWSWSSSPGIDPGEAWGLGFISGQQSSIPAEGSRYDTRVLCVRRAGK